MTTDPFAAVKAQAKEHRARLADQKRAAEALRREQAKADAEKRRAEARQEKIHQFGKRFLEVVAVKVARPQWEEVYIDKIEAYAMAMLCQSNKELPKINPRHAEAILDKFEYGLSLPQNHGLVPDDFFFGQRLLTERQSEEEPTAKPDKISYDPVGPSVDEFLAQAEAVRPTPVQTTSSTKPVDKRGPATTPKKRGRDGRPAAARQHAKAS